MPPQELSLASFKGILVAYDKQYRASRGDKRDKVVEELIGEIIKHPEYKFKNKMEELKMASLFYHWVSMILST
jgi:hypothetical protein